MIPTIFLKLKLNNQLITIYVYTFTAIEKCTTAILKYRHEVDGKTFKYDENNHYQCLLATYDMAVLNNPKREKSKLFGKIYEKYKSEAPKGNIHNFYLYNVEVFKILFDTYGWLTPSKLCKHFLSNENTESTNIKKENTVE
ncbi:uncharacterized protein LOC107883574 [Acyrthosiphon pisum]|uniref:Uncharacterized protein n=1 Tax=Acyrthosiphon pisum TaxID=7029 RepID=A0A8R2D3T3_ACYPI|nr:uncharacterized protein LOC107883574 [Acyrthosiphon pisum]|eukprot:XP_016659292.1 PREDICTED: uncharacterized protein LOC107883574 [Acyrthosiphon pisum]